MSKSFVDNKIQLAVDGKFIHVGVEERDGVPTFIIRALHGSLVIMPDLTNQIAVRVVI